MTRAQRRLVVIGNWPRTPKPLSGTGVPAPLKLLQHRAPFQPSLAPLAGAISDPQLGVEDEFGVRWKIPDLAAEEDRAAAYGRQPASAAPTAHEVGAWASELRVDRAAARERMDRPLFTAASGHAADLDRLAAAGTLDRPTAQAVGKIVHRALEQWNLEADGESEWRRRRDRALAAVAARMEGAAEHRPVMAARAGEWCAELFDRLRRNGLLERLRDSAPAVIARELPLIVTRAQEDDAVVGVTGTVDLLLRGARPGELVVVDYKTDEIESEEDVQTRAAVYAPQLGVYARAIRSALGLARDPRTELWFLWPGVVRAVGPGGGA